MINPLQKILDQEKSMNALAGKLFVSTPYISNCIRGGYANPQRLAEQLEAVGMVPSSEEFLSEYRAWRKEKMDVLQKGNSSGEEKISPPEETEELEKTADIILLVSNTNHVRERTRPLWKKEILQKNV